MVLTLKPTTSSWQSREVAEGQLKLVLDELSRFPARVAPHLAILQAMRSIKPEGMTLLDVGCGVGAYSQVLKPFKVEYFGTDFSPHMIELARKNFVGNFSVCEFSENHFGDYDIVLAGAVMEYAGRWDALNLILDNFHRYAILHRMRFRKESKAFQEKTYAGHSEEFYFWNENQFIETCKSKAKIIKSIRWDAQDTVLVEKL
jgi:SAM-dependent methyltransferase